MNRKAQITLEAVLLPAIFVAAGLAMFVYFRRAIQGNWRSNTDSFSDEQFDRREGNKTEETITFSLSKQNSTVYHGRDVNFIGSTIGVDVGADNNNNLPDADKIYNVAQQAKGDGFIDIPDWGGP